MGSTRTSSQSAHHSQTLPHTLCRPYPLGSNVSTGAVPRYPSAPVLPPGKLTLEDVHLVAALRFELFTPGERLSLEPSPGGHLPLGLGGQAGSCPGAVGLCVVPRHVDDGMIRPIRDVRLWTLRDDASSPPLPGATTAHPLRRGSQESRRGAARRRRKTIRTSPRRSATRWPRRTRRTADCSPRNDRSGTYSAPRMHGPLPVAGVGPFRFVAHRIEPSGDRDERAGTASGRLAAAGPGPALVTQTPALGRSRRPARKRSPVVATGWRLPRASAPRGDEVVVVVVADLKLDPVHRTGEAT